MDDESLAYSVMCKLTWWPSCKLTWRPCKLMWENTPSPLHEHWVWPECGKGTGRWVGLIKSTLCSSTCIFMSNNSHDSGQKTMINITKVLEPSPLRCLRHSKNSPTLWQPGQSWTMFCTPVQTLQLSPKNQPDDAFYLPPLSSPKPTCCYSVLFLDKASWKKQLQTYAGREKSTSQEISYKNWFVLMKLQTVRDNVMVQ